MWLIKSATYQNLIMIIFVSDDSVAPMTNHNQSIYDPTAQPNTINHAISDCTTAKETKKRKEDIWHQLP
jgi:hypothetical protein